MYWNEAILNNTIEWLQAKAEGKDESPEEKKKKMIDWKKHQNRGS